MSEICMLTLNLGKEIQIYILSTNKLITFIYGIEWPMYIEFASVAERQASNCRGSLYVHWAKPCVRDSYDVYP